MPHCEAVNASLPLLLNHADVEVTQLLLRNRGRRAEQRVHGALRFGKRHNLADVVALSDQHHHPVDSAREAAVGRCAVLESVKQLAELLLQGPVAGKNMQYFNKPPQIGKATPPHQDGYYFMLDPCEALTMWLALEEVDEENGCVRYVRGSHRRGLRPHGRTQTLGFSQGVTDYGTPQDLADEVAFPAQPGDLLVHNAMTIHRADGNLSRSRTRQAIGFIYYSERAKEDEVAYAAYQKRLAEEMKAKGNI